MSVKLHIDLETLQLIQGPGLRSAVNSLRFKRGDAARLQVVFLENGISPVPIGDPDALEIQIGIKPRNQFDHSYLAHSADWSMPADGDDTPTYECELSFNTLQLNSALNVGSATVEELPEITLMGEITWREGNGEPTSTRTFLVVVENDVNRGTEGAPSDANPGNITLTGTIAASNLSGTNTGDNSPNSTSATAAQGDLADSALQPVAVDYRGAYNNGDATYGIGSVVLFSGMLYEKISNPNNAGYPPTGTDWELFEPLIGSPAYDLWVQTSLASSGNALPLAGGTMDDNATILWDNGSAIREAGDQGLEIECSVGYRWQWVAGRMLLRQVNSGQIKRIIAIDEINPAATDDETQGFVPGTRWETVDGSIYLCTDATTGAAVWLALYDNTTGFVRSNDGDFIMDLNSKQLLDGTNTSLDWENRQLTDGFSSYASLDWNNRQLIAPDGIPRAGWNNYGLNFGWDGSSGFYYTLDASGINTPEGLVVDLGYKQLKTSESTSLDWNNRQLIGPDGVPQAGWDEEYGNSGLRFGWDGFSSFYHSLDASGISAPGGLVVDIGYKQLKTSGSTSLDWENRQLIGPDGTVVADWSTGVLSSGIGGQGFQVYVDAGSGAETALELLVGNTNNRFFDQYGNANYAESAASVSAGSITSSTLTNCYVAGGLSFDAGAIAAFFGATVRFDKDGDDNRSAAEFTGGRANFSDGAIANFYSGGSSFYGNGGSAAFGSGSSTGFSDGSTLALNGLVTEGVSSRSGAGAVPLTHPVCRLTSTGSAQAITLANGTVGQKLTIYHGVDGGSMVLTATTKTGWTTSITFTNPGDNVVLQYFATVGWLVLSSRGATVS